MVWYWQTQMMGWTSGPRNYRTKYKQNTYNWHSLTELVSELCHKSCRIVGEEKDR